MRRVLVVCLAAALLATSGCATKKAASIASPLPTETVVPSPTSSAALAIAPASGALGVVFAFTATGFQSGEVVKFKITQPSGTVFTGPAHTVAADGTVKASYKASSVGDYSVAASGDKGDSANGQFTVTPGPSKAPIAPVRHTAAPTRRPTPVPTTTHPVPTATPRPTY